MVKKKKQFNIKFFLVKSIFWVLLICTGMTILLVLPLRWLNPPFTSFQIIDAISNTKNPYLAATGSWLDYTEIPANMKIAVIAAEDQRFPQHHGVDIQAIWRAYKNNQHGGRIKGGSTITQQLAKNLYLWPGRSYIRKSMEAWLAIWMELLWSKQRILEIYLNVVEFGPNIFGIDAAARNFYHQSGRFLTRNQCAALVAVLPRPKKYNPRRLTPYLQQKQTWILQQMRQLGGKNYVKKLAKNRKLIQF